ncbi:hypothetical protein FORC065_2482 [Yersinia enterocolitica]|nr:hypothetical protein FORC065_2482 [Yersinia enterocolitica]
MTQLSSKSIPDKVPHRFIVKVINYHGVWVAECDDLGLVSEADSYEELTEEVRKMAPELYLENYPGNDPEAISLSFARGD